MTSSADLSIAADIAQSLDAIEAALAVIEPAMVEHLALRDDVRAAIGELDVLIDHVERSDA